MPRQAFPADLLIPSPRATRTGDPGWSVQGLNTFKIADGALVYCEENKSDYRLDRADDTTPPDGNLVIAPTAGPGRWKLFGGGPGATGLDFDLYVNRPASSINGGRFVAKDGWTQWIWDDDLGVWRPLINGLPGKQVPDVAAWNNSFGTGTKSDLAGTVVVASDGGGAFDMSGLSMDKPGVNYTATAHFARYSSDQGTTPNVTGFALLDGAGAYLVWGVGTDGYTNRLVKGAMSGGALDLQVVGLVPWGGTGIWMRVVATDTDYSWQVSQDGLSWTEVTTTLAGPATTTVGIAVNTAIVASLTLDSWELQSGP